MPVSSPLLRGDPAQVGSYRLTGRLGEGGQGVVFLGADPAGETVAVKLLLAHLDARARERFVRELESTKRVAGFCTARVLDADLAGDRPFIVSEYVPGPSLAAAVAADGPLTGGALERLAIGTLTALVAIHHAGVMHRDFKPPNVVLGGDGPRVIDFGIARALDGTSTQASGVIGTPAYMAPEQLAGRRIGTAADVFAWGVTMVYAATGTPAFGHDSIPAIVGRILHGEPELGFLTGPVRGLVLAALAKDPALRPTAMDLLLRLMGGGAQAAAPADLPPTALLMMGENRAAVRPDTIVPNSTTWPAAPPPVPPPGRRTARSPRGIGAALAFIAATLAIGVFAWFAYLFLADQKPASRTVPNVVTMRVEIAQNRIRAAGLDPIVVHEQSKKTPDTVLSTDPLAGAKVARNSQVSLVVAQAGPVERVTVPEVDGSTYPTAVTALHGVGLSAAKVEKESTAPEGRVLSSAPRQGTEVEEGTVVTLTVSKGTPNPSNSPDPPEKTLVTVPDVTGKPYEQAVALLTAPDLNLRVDRTDVESGTVPEGQVISSTPKPGARVEQKSTVTLTVSTGSPDVLVPPLRGLDVAQATAVLKEAGLVPMLGREQASYTIPSGQVISSDPGEGSHVKKGSVVTLTISNGIPPGG